MNKKIIILIIAIFPLSIFAETIKLKSGQTISGKITKKNQDSIQINVADVTLTYYLDEIASIRQTDIQPSASLINYSSYKNKALNFQVNYPTNWTENEAANGVSFSEKPITLPWDENIPIIGIAITPAQGNPIETAKMQYEQVKGMAPAGKFDEIEKLHNVSFNGLSGIRYASTMRFSLTNSSMTELIVILTDGNNEITISCKVAENLFKKYNASFNDVINSFKLNTDS